MASVVIALMVVSGGAPPAPAATGVVSVVRDPIDWPEVTRAFIVDASWATPCVLVGWYSFIRRDVLG